MVRMAWLIALLWMLPGVSTVHAQDGATAPMAQPATNPPEKTPPDFPGTYARAGSPRVVVYADIGGLSPKGAEGPASRLGGEIEDQLRTAGVTVVPAPALTPGQADVVRSSGSFAAARIVGKAANADTVLYLRVVEQAGKAAGVPSYTGTFVLADLRRGTTLGTHAWDIIGADRGVTDAQVEETAARLAAVVQRQFTTAFPPGGNMMNARRHVVRLVGPYTSDDLATLVEGLSAGAEFKQGSVQLRAEDATEVGRVATLEVASVAELPDVRRAVRRDIVSQLAMSSAFIDSREGAIGLKVTPLAVNERERLLMGGAQIKRNTAERERLRLAYANAARPRILVMLNPEKKGGQGITPVDRVRVGPGISGQLLDQAGERADRRQEFDPRLIEDCLSRRLQELGLNVVDAANSQRTLLARAENANRAWTSDDLARELGAAAGAAIVITGNARTTREGEAQGAIVTLRAIDLPTGSVVAETEVQAALGTSGEAVAQSTEELSAQAAGRLITALTDRWEGTARR
ncbi:MAG TPA: hypothetical protein VD997_11385 [Phycisphaerales bacterium]|nr:hypothetical protein [Phycisphaerales bacterium]